MVKPKEVKMLFENLSDNYELLSPALAVVDEVLIHYRKFEKEELKEITFGFLHYRYLMNYDDVKADMELPKIPTSLRLLAFGENRRPLAVYELSVDKKKPKLLSTRLSKPLLDGIVELANKLYANQKSVPEGGSIGKFSHLSIPSLNMEAHWFQHPDGKTNDFYHRDIGSGKLFIKSEKELFSLMNEMKIRREKKRDKLREQFGHFEGETNKRYRPGG